MIVVFALSRMILKTKGGKFRLMYQISISRIQSVTKGRIPDILATRGNRTKVVEIETPSTVDAHQEQHSTFRRSVAQRENGEFELVVTKPREVLTIRVNFVFDFRFQNVDVKLESVAY